MSVLIVSDRHEFVFVHNPKCGGSVLRSAIEQAHDHPVRFWDVHHSDFFDIALDYAHLRTWELSTLYPDIFRRLETATSLVFVRDPVRRFVSALHQHCRTYRPGLSVDQMSTQEKLGAFRELASVHITPARVLTDYQYVHFSPQNWFCMLQGTRVVERIVPLGRRSNAMEFARDILELEINSAAWREDELDDDDPLLADPVLNGFARHFYRKDYELFASLPHVRSVLRV